MSVKGLSGMRRHASSSYGCRSLPSTASFGGGHLYRLPPRGGYLIWDKIVRNFTSGVAELAWTTLDQPIKAMNYSNGSLASEGKVHPTQKPLPIMQWCIAQLPAASQAIADPYMGSGTTGVAAVKSGRKFVGIERERKYFDIARRRIEAALSQQDLFITIPPQT